MDWLYRILVCLTVGIVSPFFYLLARFFPIKPQIPPKDQVSFDELQSKYAKLVMILHIPYFAFSVVSVYLLYRSLIWIFHHSLPQNIENRYLMLPDLYFFGLPALFASRIGSGASGKLRTITIRSQELSLSGTGWPPKASPNILIMIMSFTLAMARFGQQGTTFIVRIKNSS